MPNDLCAAYPSKHILRIWKHQRILPSGFMFGPRAPPCTADHWVLPFLLQREPRLDGESAANGFVGRRPLAPSPARWERLRARPPSPPPRRPPRYRPPPEYPVGSNRQLQGGASFESVARPNALSSVFQGLFQWAQKVKPSGLASFQAKNGILIVISQKSLVKLGWRGI